MTKFQHDCDHCVSLGDHEAEGHHVELYYCAKEHTPALSSLIARYGNEPGDYASSHPPEAFADGVQSSEWAAEVIKRAREAGVYIQPTPEKRMLPCRGCGERFLFTTKEEHYCCLACARNALGDN